MRSMRVGIDISVTAFNRAGNARYAQYLHTALQRTTSTNLEVIPLSLPLRFHAQQGLRRKALVAFWEFVYAPRLLNLLARRARVDLLHLTMPMPIGAGGPPVVLTVLDLTPVLAPQWFTLPTAIRARHWLWQSLRRAAAIVTISQHTKADLLRVVPELAVPVRPVLLGSFLEQVEDSVPLPAGVSAPGYLLSVGTLEPRKNLGLVLEAYSKLVGRLPTAPPLVVVGGAGWKTEDLGALATRLGVADRVVRLGFVSDEQLYALYSHAAALLYPSRYEGFGFPILEAMGCGCPVITSNNSSLPEVVGEAGMLIDADRPAQLANAIHLLLTQPGLAAAMRLAGLERARGFSWERCARETVAVYREVAGA